MEFANPRGTYADLLFYDIFAESCMKMKEIWHGASRPSEHLGSANAVIVLAEPDGLAHNNCENKKMKWISRFLVFIHTQFLNPLQVKSKWNTLMQREN